MTTALRCLSCEREIAATDRFCPWCGERRDSAPTPAAHRVPKVQNVRVTGVDIPFWDLAMFLVWFSLAMIPAALILLALGLLVALAVSALGVLA